MLFSLEEHRCRGHRKTHFLLSKWPVIGMENLCFPILQAEACCGLKGGQGLGASTHAGAPEWVQRSTL